MGHPAEPPSAAEESVPPPPPHEGQRAIPTPFLTKTYQLVDDPYFDDVISWNEDGSTFVVWQPAEFARDVLPKNFKHNNFSSFVRQLNTYGFRKIASDRWEFANECFRRGEKRLLCDIHRRKLSPTAIPSAAPANRVMSSETSGDEQVRSTTSSPSGFQPEPAAVVAWASPGSSGGASELAEENNRLRRENKQLSQELGQMKSLCTNIMQLMAKYALFRKNGAAATTAVSGGGGASAAPPLEAGGSSGERGSTRLFGVSIGFKRNRGEDGGVASTSAAVMGDDGMVPVLGRSASG
ncbi:heat stress transcription factor B-2b [Musa acuminata AAA Group]|uniref:heat stress transcription factor B-2b n=1 Tax=Musa acuminata AAA Group TaxID=214697 RepID=UPI0031D6A0C3